MGIQSGPPSRKLISLSEKTEISQFSILAASIGTLGQGQYFNSNSMIFNQKVYDFVKNTKFITPSRKLVLDPTSFGIWHVHIEMLCFFLMIENRTTYTYMSQAFPLRQ